MFICIYKDVCKHSQVDAITAAATYAGMFMGACMHVNKLYAYVYICYICICMHSTEHVFVFYRSGDVRYTV